MTDSNGASTWPLRFGIIGLAAPAIAALGAYGSGWGLWPFRTGFLILAVAMLLALVALIGGLVGLVRRRVAAGRAVLLIGMLAATGLLAMLGNTLWQGSRVPAIHDVSTDLANPPQFERLTLRADNLAGLDGGIGEWRSLHRSAYADIGPLRLAEPPAAVMERAAQIVRARGWDVTIANANRIEATETISPFRFKDDILIVATAEAGGSATRIDIRSVSRVGISDLGANARRVRTLLDELSVDQ